MNEEQAKQFFKRRYKEVYGEEHEEGVYIPLRDFLKEKYGEDEYEFLKKEGLLSEELWNKYPHISECVDTVYCDYLFFGNDWEKVKDVIKEMRIKNTVSAYHWNSLNEPITNKEILKPEVAEKVKGMDSEKYSDYLELKKNLFHEVDSMYFEYPYSSQTTGMALVLDKFLPEIKVTDDYLKEIGKVLKRTGSWYGVNSGGFWRQKLPLDMLTVEELKSLFLKRSLEDINFDEVQQRDINEYGIQKRVSHSREGVTFLVMYYAISPEAFKEQLEKCGKKQEEMSKRDFIKLALLTRKERRG